MLFDRVGQLPCFLYFTYNPLRLNILPRFAPEDLLNQDPPGGGGIRPLQHRNTREKSLLLALPPSRKGVDFS